MKKSLPKPGEIYLHEDGEERTPFVVVRTVLDERLERGRVEAVILKCKHNDDVYGSFQTGGAYSYNGGEHDDMKNDKKIGELNILALVENIEGFSAYVDKWVHESLKRVRQESLGTTGFSEEYRAEIDANIEKIANIVTGVARVARRKIGWHPEYCKICGKESMAVGN